MPRTVRGRHGAPTRYRTSTPLGPHTVCQVVCGVRFRMAGVVAVAVWSAAGRTPVPGTATAHGPWSAGGRLTPPFVRRHAGACHKAGGPRG